MGAPWTASVWSAGFRAPGCFCRSFPTSHHFGPLRCIVRPDSAGVNAQIPPVRGVGATGSHVFAPTSAVSRSSRRSRDWQSRKRTEPVAVIALGRKTRLSVARWCGRSLATEPTNERPGSTAWPSVRSPGGTPWQHLVIRSIDLPAACDRWRGRAETDSLDGTEGVIDHYAKRVELPPGADIGSSFRRLEDRLLTYQVFPPRLMRAHICSDDGRLHEGITIVQRVPIGPLTLEAGVRVIRVWHHEDAEREETGFTYVTLQGHPERGISTFRLRRLADPPSIDLLIDVRSRPGSLFTRLGVRWRDASRSGPPSRLSPPSPPSGEDPASAQRVGGGRRSSCPARRPRSRSHGFRA